MLKKKTLVAIAAIFIFCFGTTAFADDTPQPISDVTAVRVTSETTFTFTPTATGYWNFITSDSGEVAPLLQVSNIYGQGLAYAVDHWGSEDAHIVIHLVEGAQYLVTASPQWHWGEFTLSVYLADSFVRPVEISYYERGEIPGYGGTVTSRRTGILSFTPDVSGFWTFDVVNADQIIVYDSFGNAIGQLDFWNTRTDTESTMTLHLVEGAEYIIEVSAPWRTQEGYTLTVSHTDEFEPWQNEFAFDLASKTIAVRGGPVTAQGETMFSFTPNVTGAWEFVVSDIFDDFVIVITDSYESFAVVRHAWSWRDSTRVNMRLAAGHEYILVVAKSEWTEGDLDSEFTLIARPYTLTEPAEPRVETRMRRTIPSEGGRQMMHDGDNLFAFRPTYTGTWVIQPGPRVHDLHLFDQSQSFSLSLEWHRNDVITITLAGGIEYFIDAGWGFGDSDFIIVSPHYELNQFYAGMPTVRSVTQEMEFSFIPNETGLWVIRSDGANWQTHPQLWLLDAYGNIIASDDGASGERDAVIKREFVAGSMYTVRAGFFVNDTGQYWLYVHRIGGSEPEFVRLPTPVIY